MLAWIACYLRGHHDPQRYPLGGFKCRDCGEAGADMEAMGLGDGYVIPVRRVFSRGEEGGLARTSEWEPTGRGW